MRHIIFLGAAKNRSANKEHYFAKYARNLFEQVETRCLDGNYWCNCMKKQGFKQVVKNLTQDTTYQKDFFFQISNSFTYLFSNLFVL